MCPAETQILVAAAWVMTERIHNTGPVSVSDPLCHTSVRGRQFAMTDVGRDASQEPRSQP